MQAPSTLITGRKDGHLLVWNTITFSQAAVHHIKEGQITLDRELESPRASPTTRKPHPPSSAGGGAAGGGFKMLQVTST